MEEEIKVTIPRATEKEVVNLPKGSLGDINKRFEKIDQVLFGVMISVVLSMIAIIVSVIGLFIDQMRYNNVAYKEYSQKTESVETTQKVNETLLKELQGLAGQAREDRAAIKQLLMNK